MCVKLCLVCGISSNAVIILPSEVDNFLSNTKHGGFTLFHGGIGSAYGDEINASLLDNLKSVCLK